MEGYNLVRMKTSSSHSSPTTNQFTFVTEKIGLYQTSWSRGERGEREDMVKLSASTNTISAFKNMNLYSEWTRGWVGGCVKPYEISLAARNDRSKRKGAAVRRVGNIPAVPTWNRVLLEELIPPRRTNPRRTFASVRCSKPLTLMDARRYTAKMCPGFEGELWRTLLMFTAGESHFSEGWTLQEEIRSSGDIIYYNLEF